jgi:hypothetical protein
MKTLLFISPIVFALFSCNSQKGLLYGRCHKHYLACGQILLKPNKEFEYFMFFDAGGATILKGDWQAKKDTVILNTYEQEQNRIDTIIESATDNPKSEIMFEGGFVGYITIDKAKIYFGSNEQTVTVDSPLKDITFHFINELAKDIPVHYNLKNPGTNQLLVKVRWVRSSSVLNNQVLVRKRNSLVYTSKSWILKRTNIKNKQW